MFEKEFDDLSIADIRELVDAGVPEGRRLEFKREHYGSNDAGKREFAADVSAMANAIGGYLVIGVEENNGAAANVCGVVASDPDGLVRTISQRLRTSFEPPLLEFRVKWFPIEAQRGVLVVKIAKSWSAPHRVTVAHERHFFVRNENGKHPMSVDELRRSFLFASEVEERIRRFRAERLEILTRNEGPLAVGKDGDPRLVINVVPRASLTDDIRLDLNESRASSWPCPLGANGANFMFSLDGLVSYSGPEERFDSVRAFSTLFRNGVAEAVAKVHVNEKEDRRTVSLTVIEQYVTEGLHLVFGEYKNRTIPPPYTLMISLLGTRGLVAPIDEWRGGLAYPCRSDRVLLPEFVFDAERATDSLESLLKPLFDLMWNAFGQRSSPNYDKGGQYVRR